MCLIVVAWQIHPLHDLVLAANRDEHHSRPTRALDRWDELPGIGAGRDLVAAGTWLAAHEDGRFAAVTNVHEKTPVLPQTPSRGDLVAGFLAASDTPEQHARHLAGTADRYAGFNLLLGDATSLWYVSNRDAGYARALAPGLHALSNHSLGTDWPKLRLGLDAMRQHVDGGRTSAEGLFDMLAMREAPVADEALAWPASSGPFVLGEQFGTRASTLVLRESGNATSIEERRFGPGGVPLGATRLLLARRGAPP